MQLQLTSVPCPEHQPRLWVEQTEAEPWSGWWAHPVLWGVAGCVTKGPKDTCRQETRVGGLISPTNPKLLIPWLLGRKPTASEVQSIPANPNPRAVGYTLARQFHRAKGPPLGGCTLPCAHMMRAHRHRHSCMHLDAHTCLHPPCTYQAHTQVHVPSLTNPSMSPDAPKPRPCIPAPSRAACHCHVRARLPACQRPASCHGNAAPAKR